MTAQRDPTAAVVLGRTQVRIGTIGFGTAPLATAFWNNEEDHAVAAVRAACDAGVRWFDTAPLYGSGESEQRLGRALRHGDGTAEPIVVATKVGRTLRRDSEGRMDAVFDFSYDAVMRSLEGSLSRLQRDRVDIVHVHDPDDHLHAALDGAHAALVDLRAAGTIGAVSVGTNSAVTARFFLEHGDLDCMLVAGRLTLLDQQAAGLVRDCARGNVAYLAAGVFNSGVLARPHDGSWFDYAPVDPTVLARVRAIEHISLTHGVSLRRAALHFPFTLPITACVVGMSSADEVMANLDDVRHAVPDDLWRELRAEGYLSPESTKGS